LRVRMRGNAQGLVCNFYRALSNTYTGSMHPRENSSARAKRVTDFFLLRQVMPVAAASIGVRLAPSTSPISGHMLMCEHSAGIFRSYAVIIMLRLIVYWQSSWASVKSIAEGKPSDSTLHHYASARVKTICSSSALFCCANARARARRFWADCRDAALVSRRTMLVVAVLASGFAQDSALCASSRTQGDNIWGLVIGWLDLLRVSSIRRCAGIMSRKAYKQGVRAPLLWPRVAGRRAFVPAGCGVIRCCLL
jgi:hypothetical protein